MHRFVLATVLVTIGVLALGAAASAQWVQHIVTTSLTSGYMVAGGDLDNDGDMDLAACSSGLSGPFTVHWYENDNGNWIDHLVQDGFDGWDVQVADMDNDGDLDIIGSGYNGSLGWWENDNTSFTYHNIAYGAGGLAMEVGDIDNDGLIDVATASTNYEILWMENNGTSWTEHVLTNTLWAHGVAIGDISGDGAPDIAGSGISEDQLRWYENSYPNPWPENIMDDNYLYVSDVGVADFDGNGYGDIVFTDSNLGLVRCYLHNGGGNFDQVDLSTNFSDGWTLAIGDLENDGDPDVAAVSMWLGVRYWINDGGTFTQHNLAFPFGTGRGIDMEDMDADGDLDIIAVNEDGTIAWWEQPGGQANPVELTVTPHTSPVIVPQGGSFAYDVHIVSNLQSTVYGWVWSEAELPNGSTYGPIDQYYLPFTPTTDILVTSLAQAIPAMAPLGDYQWRINIGQTLQTPLISDGFSFTVTAAAAADGATEWTPAGWTDQDFMVAGSEDAVTNVPGSFAVGKAYPNPFNASTRVQFTLPESRQVTAFVFDSLGRQVAELANGRYSAGSHFLTFEPSGLASGIYFLQVTAGQQHALKKLVYIK